LNGPPEDRPVLVVAGPTGSGKSALAIDAAEAFGGIVINADSAQVYRELRVLTARPSADDEARVPHRLFGVLSAQERCSAGRWLGLARAVIEAAWAEGRLPIVAGGSGLYLRALAEGLAPVPPIPGAVRADTEALYARLGGERFREELRALDPEAAARLPATDRQRLVRAFEVVRATGRTLGDWQRRPAAGRLRAAVTTLVLLPSRAALYPALDARFEAMLAAGALREAEALLALGVDPGLPVLKALGLRELAAHLAGTMTREEASARAKQATRQFAKRQMTWLRHQVRADAVFSEQYSESIRQEIFAFIRRRLLTPAT
jgi:tRNA dimethylallyltransferase